MTTRTQFTPVIVQKIGKAIRLLKQRGLTILLVEQNVRFAQTVADRHCIVENGRVIDVIRNDDLSINERTLETMLPLPTEAGCSAMTPSIKAK
jgi:branched-chain amino acid transport system ATP-binding protein